MDWTCVTNCNDVDQAYSEFWNCYKACHDTNFPLKRKRFNKNYHKLQQFMTAGLLISRSTKNKLHKLSITDPSMANTQKYKNYKTIYSRVLRGAKKLYFKKKINDNIGNPKKTWDTLNELMGKAKKKDLIAQLNINDVTETEPTKIANHFNSFFTSIGSKIANDVPAVAKPPEDYINYGRPIPDMSLGNTTPEHVLKNNSKVQIQVQLRHSWSLF
jgi:hypothetical protein